MGWAAAHAQGPAVQAAREVVQTQAFSSLEPVPRGRSFELAVVVTIRPGYHINAHRVSDPFLIPTELLAHFPPDVRLLGSSYPEGEEKRFSFSPTPLRVYTGRVVLRLKAQAGARAHLGERALPLELRYQACSDTICLPPVTVPVQAQVQVVPQGTAARATHPELFRP
jgi:hypothetical protein